MANNPIGNNSLLNTNSLDKVFHKFPLVLENLCFVIGLILFLCFWLRDLEDICELPIFS